MPELVIVFSSCIHHPSCWMTPQEAHISPMFSHYLNMNAHGNTNPDSPTSASSPSGPTPQSPNSQLTMNLLNNLLQMQGLENNIVSQQLSASAQASTQTSSSSAQPQSPGAAPSSPNSFPPHLMIEQQIKLSQLQQLQQLQNQIFQQQVGILRFVCMARLVDQLLRGHIPL